MRLQGIVSWYLWGYMASYFGNHMWGYKAPHLGNHLWGYMASYLGNHLWRHIAPYLKKLVLLLFPLPSQTQYDQNTHTTIFPNVCQKMVEYVRVPITTLFPVFFPSRLWCPTDSNLLRFQINMFRPAEDSMLLSNVVPIYWATQCPTPS